MIGEGSHPRFSSRAPTHETAERNTNLTKQSNATQQTHTFLFFYWAVADPNVNQAAEMRTSPDLKITNFQLVISHLQLIYVNLCLIPDNHPFIPKKIFLRDNLKALENVWDVSTWCSSNMYISFAKHKHLQKWKGTKKTDTKLCGTEVMPIGDN